MKLTKQIKKTIKIRNLHLHNILFKCKIDCISIFSGGTYNYINILIKLHNLLFSTRGMDYDKVVKKIGGFGRYQHYCLFLLSLSAVFNALTTFALNFVIGEHNHR